MTVPRHVAPAAKVFTVAHIADTGRPPPDPSSRGWTVCGQPMLTDDLWIDYQPTPLDRLCQTCTKHTADHEQGALL